VLWLAPELRLQGFVRPFLLPDWLFRSDQLFLLRCRTACRAARTSAARSANAASLYERSHFKRTAFHV